MKRLLLVVLHFGKLDDVNGRENANAEVGSRTAMRTEAIDFMVQYV
jgi:hypothetical protein